MKRILALVAFFLLSAALVSNALAFRCGTHLISIGDKKSEVLRSCGSPDWTDSWEEERIERVYAPAYYNNPKKMTGARVPIAVVVHVNIEEWTYNLGPTQFMRTLRFENSKLVDIETGDYGN